MIAMAGANVSSVVFLGSCLWDVVDRVKEQPILWVVWEIPARACRRNLGWLRKIQHGDVITHPCCGDLMWDLEWSGESHLTIKGCPWSMFPSLDLSRSVTPSAYLSAPHPWPTDLAAVHSASATVAKKHWHLERSKRRAARAAAAVMVLMVRFPASMVPRLRACHWSCHSRYAWNCLKMFEVIRTLSLTKT